MRPATHSALRPARIPPLVAVAHGSRDPRSAAAVRALCRRVRRRWPGLDVRVAFLGLSEPGLPDVLAGLAAEGCPTAVLVPLLLGAAYHARVDIPNAVQVAAGRHPELHLRVAGVLGPDPRLGRAALDRLAAAGADPSDPDVGVVLAAAGSSQEPANAAVRAVAWRWTARTGWAGTVAAFAAAAAPDLPTAIARLRRRGARRIAVGSWFLAPGLLPDRIIAQARAADPGVLLAEPLADAPELVEIVLDRYWAALSGDRPAVRLLPSALV